MCVTGSWWSLGGNQQQIWTKITDSHQRFFFPLRFALHLNNSTIQLTLIVWIHSYNDMHIKALKMSINFMVWLWSTVSLLAFVWVYMCMHSVRTCACSALSKPIPAPSTGQLSRFSGCTACPTMWLNPRCSLKTLLPHLLFLCRPPCLTQHITCQVLRLDGKLGVEASHVHLNVT